MSKRFGWTESDPLGRVKWIRVGTNLAHRHSGKRRNPQSSCEARRVDSGLRRNDELRVRASDMRNSTHLTVIPANAGIHNPAARPGEWIPAFAGMTS